MTRRLLLVAGGSGPSEPVGPLPPDPNLTEPRLVTAPLAINQNVFGVTATGGTTWEYAPITLLEDAVDPSIVFSGASQGTISDPATLKVSIRKPGATTFQPVLFGGSTTATLSPEEIIESDVIPGYFPEGQTLTIRIWSPAGQIVNVGAPGTIMEGADHTLTTQWVPTSGFQTAGPFPLMFKGKSRPTTLSLGVYGDSIAAQAAWWTNALGEHRIGGVNFGRNVMTFSGRWLDEKAVAPLTHMLVQFGVNDLGAAPSVTSLWASAVSCYTYLDSLNPRLPLWQTTPTPCVSDVGGDSCATLAGQARDEPRATARQAWIEFLRDGAPCHPDTKAPLPVGATGTVTRAGQTGHPLKGIVDIAATTEHGGISSPSGKWRVDQGPAGGDGIHPSAIGMNLMAIPVTAWAATLTT